MMLMFLMLLFLVGARIEGNSREYRCVQILLMKCVLVLCDHILLLYLCRCLSLYLEESSSCESPACTMNVVVAGGCPD